MNLNLFWILNLLSLKTRKKTKMRTSTFKKLKYSCSVKVGTSSIYSKCSESIRNFTLNENNGEIEWRTDYFQANVYDFKVSVTDNDPSNPLSDTENFIVNVLNVNKATQISYYQ